MLILNAEDVRQALPMAKTIEAMKSAYAALSASIAVIPLRTQLPIQPENASALFMPAYVPAEEGDSLAVKIVTLFPENPGRDLPFIHAAVLVMEATTGRMLALIEGGSLTAIRTGAGAGAATDLLARQDSRTAAIFGTGPQAETQLEAVCTVRPVKEARIFSRNPSNVKQFITRMADRVEANLIAVPTPSAALKDADVICTATNARTPVFNDDDIMPGMHINAVGSYTPEMIEIPPETLKRSYVTVDSRSACAAEAGEIIAAVRQGLYPEQEIVEIGEVVNGLFPARSSDNRITYFKSVGVAVQDAAAARLALQEAEVLGLGTEVRW